MSVAAAESSPTRVQELEALVGRMQSELTATSEKLAGVTTERDNLRRAYRQLMEQFELLRRRIFIAKAERIDATQLELEFEETKQKLDALAQQLEGDSNGDSDSDTDASTAGAQQGAALSRPSGKPPGKAKTPPKGRRNLAERDDLPQRRIEIRDVELEKGGAIFIGWEESYKLGYQRPEEVRVVLARAKYKTPVAEAEAVPLPDDATVIEQDGARFTIVTAPLPPLLIRRGLLAPSMLARVIVQKFRFGMPYFRQEEQLEADGIELDRGTMARSVEEVGACLGAIVLACADDARKHAFCLSTDATGVAIRPEPLPDGRRQPCRKGHFFVVLADKKHIFFEYQPKHTSAVVCEMFRGFSGYIQADAHAIYDALFRGDAVDNESTPPLEVACWSHARRRFWEAAVCGFAVGREGLWRIRRLYDLDQAWSELPPAARLQKRKSVLAPFVDEFFEWVRKQNDLSSQERGLVSKALGYAIRQELALRRFLDDGRLRMDDNRSENALRIVATGRKSWLFFGSDDTAEAAANLYSLIASCKLHGIDPERYLAEVIRIMPYWPRDRYLELAPAYWKQTRARLDPGELDAELGHVTVPSAIADTAQQPSPG
ncbi:MAG TPA: IS66 family transposase [Polyangiaceae bacterium]|nr:IS66 family transposase [Polyangiaceae bacterium]